MRTDDQGKPLYRRSYIFWLSILVLLGLFFVNTAGFLDTFTGSALGCGHEWPLCNGQLVPHAQTIQTIIEFSHRGIVGVVTILLLILAVLSWWRFGRYVEMKAAILLTVGFVFVEAALGALGVLLPDPPAVLAVHFGVALIAWAGGIWMVVLIGQIESRMYRFGWRRLPKQSQLPALRSPVISKGRRIFSWITVLYTVGALYFGALVAATGAGGVFRGFPLPTETAQAAHGLRWLDYGHRSIAAGIVILILITLIQAIRTRKSRPDLLVSSIIAACFVVTQAFTGAWLVYSHVHLAAFMGHVSSVTILFGAVSVIGLQALPEHNRLLVDRLARNPGE